MNLHQLLQPAANPATLGKHIYDIFPAAHHWDWLYASLNPRITRLLLVAPRESAKTTWMGEVRMAWQIGTHPLSSNIIASVTDAQAAKRMEAIRTVIEHDENWRTAFPHIVPDYKRGWSTEALFVRDTRYTYDRWVARVASVGNLKMPTLMSAGTGSAKVIGSRFNGIALLDDPHDEKNSRTELQRDRVEEWLLRTFANTITVDGKLIVITTRWHRNDLAGRLMQNDAWYVIDQPAINPDGSSYWPSHWPIERLEAKRKEIGNRYFRAMYMNDPQGLTGRIFDSSWFLPLPETMPRMKFIALGVDLAISQKETADYTVIATVGLGEDGALYLLHIDRARRTFNDTLARVEQLALVAMHKYRLDRVAIENVAYQAAVVQELIRKTSLPIVAIRPDGDKVQRARTWETRASQGMVFADKNASWYSDFIDEVVDFPDGNHDDQVDAISTAWAAISEATFESTAVRQMPVKW